MSEATPQNPNAEAFGGTGLEEIEKLKAFPTEEAATPEEPKKRVSKYALKKRTVIISDETAHDQVMMILERNNIDLGRLDTDSEIDAMENYIDIIKEAIMYGDLEVSEDDTGEIIMKQNIRIRSKDSTVESITFGEVRGRSHRKADAKGNQSNKNLSIMAHMAKLNNDTADKIINNLRSKDLTITEALSNFFL